VQKLSVSVKQLLAFSLVGLVVLAAAGLLITETPGGPETDAASYYLLAVGIGLVALILGGIAFMFTRRDRGRTRDADGR
jgi:hypothetical protein